MPTVELQEWLASQGAEEPARQLTREEVRAWLQVWQLHQVATAAAGVPDRHSRPGSTAHRRAYQTGQGLFRPRQFLQRLRRQDGSRASDPTSVQDLLWENRSSLWASAPTEPPGGEVLLDRYFAARRAHFPTVPTLTYQQAAAVVLRAAGSAPDGIPY